MNPKDTAQTLNKFFYSGYGKGLFTHVTTHKAREVASNKFIIGPVQDIGMFATNGMTLKEYLDLISGERYSAILSDYSLIIIECHITSSKITRHRYSYIPCPFKKEVLSARPDDIEIADFLSQIIKTTLEDKVLSQGYLRFDYTDEKPPEGLYHPKSHLTFISSNCRIGLKSPISISEFLTFIFDNFYPHIGDEWYQFQPHLKITCTETLLEQEAIRMHLSWND